MKLKSAALHLRIVKRINKQKLLWNTHVQWESKRGEKKSLGFYPIGVISFLGWHTVCWPPQNFMYRPSQRTSANYWFLCCTSQENYLCQGTSW